MFRDYAVTLDGAGVALFSIQLNLAAGTLAPFVKERPELRGLLDDILAFRVSWVEIYFPISLIKA